MSKLNPFYIYLVVWGERFRNYLLEYCLPSLLSPQNIPSLLNKKNNKFLFCTTTTDWNIISHHPIFIKLNQHISTEFLEIPLPSPNVTHWQHMGVGHQLTTERCFQDQAYGILLTPDLVLSDGSLKYIERCAQQGKQVILCAAVRFAEEPLFTQLHELKSLNCLTGPQLVTFSLNAFHSETHSYDYHAPYYSTSASIAIQRVDDEGLLVHTMNWFPLLLDYRVVSTHDTHALKHWTIDGDYVYRNFATVPEDAIEVCTDSNQVMLLSWGPLNYNVTPLYSSFLRRRSKSYCQWFNAMALRNNLRTNPVYDPMKIKSFRIPIYWHVNPLTPQWHKLENQFQKNLDTPYRLTDTFFKYYNQLHDLLILLTHYATVLKRAWQGDPQARTSIKNKFNKVFRREFDHKPS